MPQLRGVLLITLILQIIGTAQVFLEPFLFTAGGPANATMTVLLLIYKYAFQNSLGGDYGAATALSLMLGRVPGHLLGRLLPADPIVGHLMAAWRRRRQRARRGARGARPGLGLPTGSGRRSGIGLRLVHLVMLLFLLIVGLGPLLWLAKSAVTPTQDTLRTPMALWPNGIDLDNLATAWNRVHIDQYFFNTVVIAAGSWLVQIVVATTAGYALSVLRPRYAPDPHGARARDPVRAGGRAARAALPDHPAPALLRAVADQQLLGGVAAGRGERLQRHPREALLRQPATRGLRGGAHGWRRARSGCSGRSCCRCRSRSSASCRSSPSSPPGRTTSGRCLVLPDPAVQPLSVRLPTLQRATELDVFMAALAISTLIPIVIFVVLQRLFLRGGRRGRGCQGVTRHVILVGGAPAHAPRRAPAG